MKKVMIAVAGALTLAGCQNARVTDLEKRVDRLEQSTRQLEADRTKAADEDSKRHAKLETCVAEANVAYERSTASNGTRQRDGSYSVPVTSVTVMDRAKQEKIEECRLLYSK
jgi:outer membrane murein-binding lipoprotein Lpp